ncbi:hypothetical protein HLH14_09595 [Acinetobacter sp. ANC 4282]|jgi:hypothetical protein|uniref:Spore coat protein U domain-containing protein n=1 Tax=Acinetobacter terrae TaxID=2731247 RepID=A0A4R0EJK2_9GAMM|nr:MULTISPECIES: hypothetical protein [Acinetobacter Taxon 24]NNH16244.1 hypothetical protein [Acinetobacter terrae]TCB52158.1 hypothetical protein E0H84_13510 [Acinetobacter terrestris]TCB56642.1 hypothetical protein E0H85_13735 [Acinetobacter terrae]
MKIFIKSAAILAALLGSGLTQAANTTASIPMGLEVPKSCSFTDVSTGIVIPENGSEGVGSFTFQCNVAFTSEFQSESSAVWGSGKSSVLSISGKKLETVIKLNLPQFGYSNSPLPHGWVWANWGYRAQAQTGSIAISLKEPITATTPAGIYIDTYKLDLYY